MNLRLKNQCQGFVRKEIAAKSALFHKGDVYAGIGNEY